MCKCRDPNHTHINRRYPANGELMSSMPDAHQKQCIGRDWAIPMRESLTCFIGKELGHGSHAQQG